MMVNIITVSGEVFGVILGGSNRGANRGSSHGTINHTKGDQYEPKFRALRVLIKNGSLFYLWLFFKIIIFKISEDRH